MPHRIDVPRRKRLVATPPEDDRGNAQLCMKTEFRPACALADRLTITARYRILSARKDGAPASLPLRSSLGTLEGGLVSGRCGNSRVFGGGTLKAVFYHFYQMGRGFRLAAWSGSQLVHQRSEEYQPYRLRYLLQTAVNP